MSGEHIGVTLTETKIEIVQWRRVYASLVRTLEINLTDLELANGTPILGVSKRRDYKKLSFAFAQAKG